MSAKIGSAVELFSASYDRKPKMAGLYVGSVIVLCGEK
jgi:hypothetical protein